MMAKLQCSIKLERDVPALIRRRNAFAFLNCRSPLLSEASVWERNGDASHDLQVVAIGKTGYGKSTTLNRLIGEDVFETSDVDACTRIMQSAEYRFQTQQTQCYFSLADLPGIGESPERDKDYITLYQQVIRKAHAVIYFLRADQRDFSVDLWAFQKLFATIEERKKIILAINAIDKIEPIQQEWCSDLTTEQQKNLRVKLTQISAHLSIPAERIVAISATEEINLDAIAHKLSTVLHPYLQAAN